MAVIGPSLESVWLTGPAHHVMQSGLMLDLKPVKHQNSTAMTLTLRVLRVGSHKIVDC